MRVRFSVFSSLKRTHLVRARVALVLCFFARQRHNRNPHASGWARIVVPRRSARSLAFWATAAAIPAIASRPSTADGGRGGCGCGCGCGRGRAGTGRNGSVFGMLGMLWYRTNDDDDAAACVEEDVVFAVPEPHAQ